MTLRPDECVGSVLVEKKIDSETPEEANLIECIEFRTAGDPDQEDIIYTDLSPQDLSERQTKMRTPVGKEAIAQWLNDAGIRRRQIRKDIRGGEHADRDNDGTDARLIDESFAAISAEHGPIDEWYE